MHRLIEKLSFNIIILELVQPDNVASHFIRYLNQPAAALLGYPKEQLINQPLKKIVVPETLHKRWQSALKKVPEGNSIDCELIHSNGGKIPVQISLSSFPDQSDKTFIVLFIEQISDRKEQEKQLFMMHRAVEQSASAVLITDPKGCVEYVNPKFTQLTGYSAQEMLGKNPNILQSGSTTPERYQALWEVLLTTGEWHGEINNRKKNGDFYWAYETLSVIKNEQGEIIHFLAIEEDITQRKKIESALTESEERFRQMAEMTGEWLWEQDPKGFYIYSSIAVKKILDFSPEEIIGKHYSELLTPQDKEALKPNSLKDRPFYDLINHYRHKNGHKVITESTGLPIIDEHGKLIKWRGVDRDITARKHYEDALIESEKRKRLIVESALNSIIIMDSYGIITDWNVQAEKLFGWPREQAIGQRLENLIIPYRFRQAHRQGLKKFLHSGQGAITNRLIEQVAIRRDGTEFPVELSVSPLKLGNNYIFSGFVHDISARKAAEQQIRQAQVNLAITQNEIKIAHQIQSSLLPAAPITSHHFEVTGYCLPATQVGGDYYDYFYRDKNHLDMVIADVSGHAVGPALFMAEARSALRIQAKWSASPAQALDALNNFLYDDLYHADYFITMFYLQYQCDTHQLSYANAGHPQPLLWQHKHKRCLKLDADGLILGIRKNVLFQEKNVLLKAGDMLLLYTDGLTEAQNPEGDFFGFERICKFFHRNAHQAPQIIIAKLLKELKQFCQTGQFNDDITLMIFKRN